MGKRRLAYGRLLLATKNPATKRRGLPSLIRGRFPAARYGRAFVAGGAYCLFQACDLQISPPNTQPLIFIEDPDSDALPE